MNFAPFMEPTAYLVVCFAALLASALTFFSGFGLGTILFPVFALFFPIDVAIATTAIVHLLNSLFKTGLIGRKASIPIVIRFGVPAIIAAFAGAYLLGVLTDTDPLHSYSSGEREFQIMPIKLVIGALLFVFALFDLVPGLRQLSVPVKYMPAGGLLSGFFGGLSGHQGALRSAFLIKAGLDKETFIATGVIIAVLIDLARITVYAGTIIDPGNTDGFGLVTAATASAFLGAYLGNRLLRKVTIHFVQLIVGSMLLLFSVAMTMGVL